MKFMRKFIKQNLKLIYQLHYRSQTFLEWTYKGNFSSKLRKLRKLKDRENVKGNVTIYWEIKSLSFCAFNNNLNFWLYFQGHPVDWSKFACSLFIVIINTQIKYVFWILFWLYIEFLKRVKRKKIYILIIFILKINFEHRNFKESHFFMYLLNASLVLELVINGIFEVSFWTVTFVWFYK